MRPTVAAPERKDTILAGTSRGLILSRDRGINWSKLSILDQPYSSMVNTIEEDPQRPGTFFLSTKDWIPNYATYGAGVWELEIPLP